jgi:hypothetical protein
MRFGIGIVFICILYSALFHPFISLMALSSPIIPKTIPSYEIHAIRAQISDHVHLSSEKCTYSDNAVMFHNVYMEDALRGHFQAKEIIWHIGTEFLKCHEISGGYMHDEDISVQSSQATYNIESGEILWGDRTQWTVG